MTQIFISYSRKDLAFVEHLAKDLRNAGFEVWYDLSNLELGMNWDKEIQAAIHNSQYMIVVISPNSLDSRWVAREYLLADNLHLTVIPILYEKCELPLWSLDLHYIDVNVSGYKKSIEEILRLLGKKSKEQLAQEQAKKTEIIAPGSAPALEINKPGKEKESKKPSNKRIPVAWLGIGIVGILGVALAGISGLTGGFKSFTFSRVTATLTPTVTMLAIIETAEPTITSTPIPAGTTSISSRDGMAMVYVPGGSFPMGEITSREVNTFVAKLDAFWIDKTEVTNGMYMKCVDAYACAVPRKKSSSTRAEYYGTEDYTNYPVINITWDMANKYCEWAGRRLPTEAEWEKAARGIDMRFYPWSDKIDWKNLETPIANFGRKIGDTSKVGSYPDGRSPYMALDIAGNVEEWVASWYQQDFYLTLPKPIINPTGPVTGEYRVLRGGSWAGFDLAIQTFNVHPEAPGFYSDEAGFRCAVTSIE